MTIFNYVAKFEASLDYRPAQEPDISPSPPPPAKEQKTNTFNYASPNPNYFLEVKLKPFLQ